MNKLLIKEYLNIINEFNQSLYIHYKPYKGVHLYINRDHFLLRQKDRYKKLTDLSYVKHYMHKFIKDNFNKFSQILITNPRGIFLIIESKNDPNYKSKFFGLQLQFKNNYYSLLLSTPLPCTDENGNSIIPYHHKNDFIYTIKF